MARMGGHGESLAPKVATAAIYDTHIHLADAAYGPYAHSLTASMDALDIAAFCVSTTAADSALSAELAARSRRIVAFAGIHPDGADGDIEPVAGLVESGRVKGIGEIGLDPTVTDERGYRRQREVFASMLSLAEANGLPASIHSRRSVDDVLDTLSSYSVRAALHWFDGNRRQLARAMDMGVYVSYGPVCVYAADKRSLIARTRPEMLLAETDGPVRFSRCFAGRAAQPCHIPSVVLCMARSRRTSYGEMRRTLAANSRRYLGI